MAVHSPATFLVPMGLLKIVLLVVMSSSCSSIAAELSTQESQFDTAPVRINAYGRRDHARSADQHVSSSSTMDDAADHAPTPRRHRKNDAPGVRFDMTRRHPSCAGSPVLQGAESRSRHFACALERSARRQSQLAGKWATTEYLRSVTEDTAAVSGEASSNWKFPESAGFGEFLVPIYLGTPPQKANIVIDTGSDLTWIQSQPCSKCYTQADPIFDPSKSSTYSKLACSSPTCAELLGQQCSSSASCRYDYYYGDGSETQGYFSTETITVDLTTGGKSAVALFEFGASDSTKGNFEETRGEGILGLGQGPVSLPSQLGNEFGNKFSYCLVDWLSADSSVTSSMYFGDAAVPKGEVQYTPIMPNAEYPTYYYIRVMGISVGPLRLPIEPSVFDIDSSGSGGTIIDSGTTLTYFLPEAYNQIAAAYKSQVKYPVIKTENGLDLCFDTAGIRSPSFPTMEIHLDEAHLRLPTLNTFVTLEENITCLAFLPNVIPEFKIAIIGNILQQNFDIVYDLENMRIGFAPADCASV